MPRPNPGAGRPQEMEKVQVENPAASAGFDAEQDDADGDDHDDGAMSTVVAGSSNISSEETVRLFEALARDAAQGQQDPSAGAALIAHLVRASSSPPDNYHQCVVYFLTTEAEADADLRAVAPIMLAGSYVMVTVQVMTTIAIWSGALFPACLNNDLCVEGMFCYQNRRGDGICYNCGSVVPLLLQTDTEGNTLNYYRAPDFAGYNTTAMAELCADPVDTLGQFEPTMRI